METPRRWSTRVTRVPLVSWLTRALPRGHAHPVVRHTVRVALGVVAEHPGPARLAVAGEALGAVPVETPGQLDTVPAAGALVSEVTLALPRLDTVTMLGVTLVTTHGHLTQVTNPSVQTLDLASCCTRVSFLVGPLLGFGTGFLLPASTFS